MKNVSLTLCKSPCTKVFTLWPRMFLQVNELPEAKLKKQRRENYQNGRERPHFFGYQPPKKFVGSLPPWGAGCGAGSLPISTDGVT